MFRLHSRKGCVVKRGNQFFTNSHGAMDSEKCSLEPNWNPILLRNNKSKTSNIIFSISLHWNPPPPSHTPNSYSMTSTFNAFTFYLQSTSFVTLLWWKIWQHHNTQDGKHLDTACSVADLSHGIFPDPLSKQEGCKKNLLGKKVFNGPSC